MKKTYSKPEIEIETYTLSEAIAGSCGITVDFGPGDSSHVVCDSFRDDFSTMTAALGPTSFYDSGYVCDCYYTAGGIYVNS